MHTLSSVSVTRHACSCSPTSRNSQRATTRRSLRAHFSSAQSHHDSCPAMTLCDAGIAPRGIGRFAAIKYARAAQNLPPKFSNTPNPLQSSPDASLPELHLPQHAHCFSVLFYFRSRIARYSCPLRRKPPACFRVPSSSSKRSLTPRNLNALCNGDIEAATSKIDHGFSVLIERIVAGTRHER